MANPPASGGRSAALEWDDDELRDRIAGEREVEAQLQRIGQADLVVGAVTLAITAWPPGCAADLVTYMVTRSPIISLAAQLPIAGLPTCSRIWSLTTACGDG
jgi:hypothetical protein